MSKIMPDVEDRHLRDHPEERKVLAAFLHSFSVTWAKRQTAFGSEVSVYLLKPDEHLDRAFGFNVEILALYSPYKTLEPRAALAFTEAMSQPPAKGRVDPKVVFLISEAADAVEWTAEYVAQQPYMPLVVVFRAEDLRQNAGEAWAVRQTIADQLRIRDLFQQDRLPIKSDSFFFGRRDVIFDLSNAYRSSANRGVFGLRKAGKTSIFLKLQRMAETEGDALFILIDCKLPRYRELGWRQLLALVADEIARRAGTSLALAGLEPGDAFVQTVRDIGASNRIVLIFDEIEYVTPLSTFDVHWKNDFVPFWQTVWHAQSEVDSLSIFLGGINAAIVDRAEIDGVQNPLFTLVEPHYVVGLTENEVRAMLRSLGSPMGLRFTHDAVRYLRGRYGGHPQMTKQACSITFRMVRESGADLPVTIGERFLRDSEQERDAEMSNHASLVLSELEKFYPDEYDLLLEIASGALADVYEFVSDPSFSAHLKGYGLLDFSESGRPRIAIGVIERALRARGRETSAMQTDVPHTERARWLARRLDNIHSRFEQLHQEIVRVKAPLLFGPNNYPNSHEFFGVGVVRDRATFRDFIGTLYQCFVESIQAFAQTGGRPDHFTHVVPNAYPELNDALNRIRAYRHYTHHQKLNQRAAEMNREFLLRDLGKPDGPQDGEQWFMLQECTLNELLVALLTELDQLG